MIILHFICLDEGVDEQAFLYMPETMIRELIPQIGKRYCFIEKRKHLLAKKKDSFSVTYN